jgi:hypothetical protein
MSTRSGRRLAIATIGALALAATLLAAAPAAAASPTACRVKNLDTGVTKNSLQQAHNAARAGQRLTVRGTCVGITTLSKNLTITGIRTATSGKPILDGGSRPVSPWWELKGTVVTVKRGMSVTLRSITIRGGATDMSGGGGISNRGTSCVCRSRKRWRSAWRSGRGTVIGRPTPSSTVSRIGGRTSLGGGSGSSIAS